MPVSEHTSAPWRHPALALVYGSVVAFLVVLAARLLIPADVPVTVSPPVPIPVVVTVHAPVGGKLRVEIEGADRLDGARLTLRDTDDGNDVDDVNSPLDLVDGLARRTPAGAEVCLGPPPGWTVTEPAPPRDGLPCRPAVGDVVFRLERS